LAQRKWVDVTYRNLEHFSFHFNFWPLRTRSRATVGRRRSSSSHGRRLSVASFFGGGRRASSAQLAVGGPGGSSDAESLLTRSSVFSKSAENEAVKLHREVIEQTK